MQAILTARIDRLPASEKELLQTLAVDGQEFRLSLVRRVVDVSKGNELDRKLANLQMAEFIYEQPAIGDVEYIFKHALTQEVAYNSLLIERRKQLHDRVAVALESTFGGRLEEHLTCWRITMRRAAARTWRLTTCSAQDERRCKAAPQTNQSHICRPV